MTKHLPPTLLCDFYKVCHKDLYPKGTEVIYSTLTPRSNRYFPLADKVVVFGIQGFVTKYLIDYFNEHFFQQPKEQMIQEYARVIRFTLGDISPDTTHIEELHELGYLPIIIKALKEGTLAPIKTPFLTVENTDKRFFWLTNYLETLISTQIWQAMTSATIAYQYRMLLDAYALKTTGSTSGVEFQGHDFSMRGMSSLESAQLSGSAHLLSFSGTDTIPAILYLENYYGADIEKELVGSSIKASEHSIMSAWTNGENRDELAAYKYLITEVCPSGFVSLVSDTYDFWAVIGDVLPQLKEDILSREGRVVIRPDSGDPVLIICGDPKAQTELERKGLIEALWDLFGGNLSGQGYKVLDPHIGAIYGDSITLERAKEIVERLEVKGFASTNIVLGIGSYSYQYNTRDTFGFAMKATYAVINGEERLLFKDPKTDDGTKRSQRGRVIVENTSTGIGFKDGLNKAREEALESINLLEPVFIDGKLVRTETLAGIRARLASSYLNTL